MPQAPLLNPETITSLQELGENDPEFFPGMIRLYQRDLAEKLLKISAALETNATREVAALSHQLKSSSGNLGVEVLCSLFAELEESASKGELTGMKRIFAEIQRHQPSLRAELETLLK